MVSPYREFSFESPWQGDAYEYPQQAFLHGLRPVDHICSLGPISLYDMHVGCSFFSLDFDG